MLYSFCARALKGLFCSLLSFPAFPRLVSLLHSVVLFVRPLVVFSGCISVFGQLHRSRLMLNVLVICAFSSKSLNFQVQKSL